MAGASFISTIDRLDAPFVRFEAGQYGWDRLAAGGTKELDNDATLTGLIEHKSYDGPWHQPEDLAHTALLGQVRAPDGVRQAGRHAVGLRRQLAPDGADPGARDRNGRVPRRVLRARPDGRRRHVALDRQRADRRRQVAGVGVPAVLRLVHAVEPDLRLPDQSVRPPHDARRPLHTHGRRARQAPAQGRRRVPLRRHRQRRRRSLRSGPVRREHFAKRDSRAVARPVSPRPPGRRRRSCA